MKSDTNDQNILMQPADNKEISSDDTLFFEAVNSSNTESCAELIRKDASLIHATQNGSSALHIASRNGNTKLVELLLKQNGIQVNMPDKNGYKPLDNAVYCRYPNKKYEAISTQLIKNGANLTKHYSINYREIVRQNASLLEVTISYGWLEALKALVDRGEDPNSRLLLTDALWCCDTPVINYLLEQKISVFYNGPSRLGHHKEPFFYAINSSKASEDVAINFLKRAFEEDPEQARATITALYQPGALDNADRLTSGTLLHIATSRKWAKMLDYLCEHAASFDLYLEDDNKYREGRGKTPFTIACYAKYRDCIVALLKYPNFDPLKIDFYSGGRGFYQFLLAQTDPQEIIKSAPKAEIILKDVLIRAPEKEQNSTPITFETWSSHIKTFGLKITGEELIKYKEPLAYLINTYGFNNVCECLSIEVNSIIALRIYLKSALDRAGGQESISEKAVAISSIMSSLENKNDNDALDTLDSNIVKNISDALMTSRVKRPVIISNIFGETRPNSIKNLPTPMVDSFRKVFPSFGQS